MGYRPRTHVIYLLVKAILQNAHSLSIDYTRNRDPEDNKLVESFHFDYNLSIHLW